MNKWIEEFAGFASRNRRRTAAERKLIGGCCADAVESQQGEPKKRPSEPDGLFFASRIVALERVCRFRIAPQVQYCTVCDSTRFHMRQHHIFHFFRLISPPILQKTFLKYIFVLQAAKIQPAFSSAVFTFYRRYVILTSESEGSPCAKATVSFLSPRCLRCFSACPRLPLAVAATSTATGISPPWMRCLR